MNTGFAVTLVIICFIFALIIVFAIDNTYKVVTFKKNLPNLPRKFTVTAHTGCLKTKPNTVESMEKGVEAGANIIEFDLRFDKNGEPVLSHNLPSDGAVSLKEAFEFLSKHKNIKANVDIKETSGLVKVKEYAAQYGVAKQIFFTGVSQKDVSAVERQCPGIPFYLNYNVHPCGKRDIAYISNIVEAVQNCGAIGINMNYKGASKELIDTFHDEGLLVSLWTVNTPLDLCASLKIYPDNITTKRPDTVRRLLSKNASQKG